MSKSEQDELLEQWLAAIFGLVIGAGGLYVLGLQIYWYMQTGNWTPISIIDAVRWAAERIPQRHDEFAERIGLRENPGLEDFIAWLHYPSTWKGVHSILDGFPATLIPLLVGFIALHMAINLPRHTAD